MSVQMSLSSKLIVQAHTPGRLLYLDHESCR